MEIFIAEFETANTRSYGYGTTPEDAVEALAERWSNDYSPQTGANRELVANYRDSIYVYEVELGRGYVLGLTDTFARRIVATGDDERFNAIFDNPSPKL